MKTLCSLLILAVAALIAGCANPPSAELHKPTVVEAACGECLFGMKGDDCDLAIRVKGHSYFVDGFNPEMLGDAHAADGICTVIRQARVTGSFKNDRFQAATFELLPSGNR